MQDVKDKTKNTNRLLFGTDGIRGVANQHPMSIEVATALGRVLGYWIRTQSQYESSISSAIRDSADRPRVCIGKDSRISGDLIQSACVAGLCASGIDVIILGVIPTPAVALITQVQQAAAGIMISASHNPFADNGIKIFNAHGYKLSDEQESQFETWMQNRVWEALEIAPHQIGTLSTDETAVQVYIDTLSKVLHIPSLKGMRIAIDCAHGASAHFTRQCLMHLGAEVHAIGVTPNGININQQCGATHPQTLSQIMKNSSQAFHLGICLDGDADRCILLDEAGTILTGDHLLFILARWLMTQKRLPHNKVVVTLMSNLGLDHALAPYGITLQRVNVGDRYVTQCMREYGLNLGGEQSGHLIIQDLNATGDALLAAFVILNIMLQDQVTLSQLAAEMHMFPQVLNSFKVPFKPDLVCLSRTQEEIAKANKNLADQGRVLVRYSGTELKARVMIEGKDLSKIEDHCHSISQCMIQEINELYHHA
jgi:phosphoglucosamine mutase